MWSRRNKGSPARQRNSSLLVSARQLQALVRRLRQMVYSSPIGSCLSQGGEEGTPHRSEERREGKVVSGGRVGHGHGTSVHGGRVRKRGRPAWKVEVWE